MGTTDEVAEDPAAVGRHPDFPPISAPPGAPDPIRDWAKPKPALALRLAALLGLTLLGFGGVFYDVARSIAGGFWYFLLAIPLVICIALAWWTPTDAPCPPWAVETPASRTAAVLVCLSIVVGFPVTVRAAVNEHIGRNQQLQFAFNSWLNPERFAAQERRYQDVAINGRLTTDYLDSQRLPAGSVLMDTFNTWDVWLNSTNPKQFTITSDYDFKAALNRPWEYGIKYLVASNPFLSVEDALNLRYPTLWNDGAGFSKLVLTMMNGASDDDRFRIYEVTGPPRTVLSPPQ